HPTRRRSPDGTPMSEPRQREFDVVLYGATGFLGKITAEYLVRAAPDGARIGLAGRSLERLARVRAGLGARAASWPLIAADAQDGDALAEMASRAPAVATTAGPFRRYGPPLLQACVVAATHYAHVTRSPRFSRC